MRNALVLVVLAFSACTFFPEDRAGAHSGDDGEILGIPRSTPLKDLTAQQMQALCHEAAGIYPLVDVTCPDSSSSKGIDDASCSDPGTVGASCTATLDDLENCIGALYSLSDEQTCTATDVPAACKTLETCDSSNSGSALRANAKSARWFAASALRSFER